MTITPKGSTEAVESNGVGLLPEEVNGNPPKLLGTITDNKNSSNKAVYEIAMGYDATPDNVNFNIEDNTLYYLGADTRDFEIAGVKKSFTITIVRYNNEADAGAKQSPQIFEYIVNLKNLNDTAPVLTGNIDEGETEIGYIAAGNVGGDYFAMAFKVNGDNDPITIKFVNSGSFFVVVPQYVISGDDTSKLNGFNLQWGATLTYAQIIEFLTTDTDSIFGLRASDPTSRANLDIFSDYLQSMEYVGPTADQGVRTIVQNTLFDAAAVTLTGTRGLVFDKDTPITEIIADFSVTDADDPDGLGSYTYSLSDSTENNDGDASYFTIDEATGELRRNADKPPTFATGTGADNIYDITITVSDGTNTNTYDLRVVVADTL